MIVTSCYRFEEIKITLVRKRTKLIYLLPVIKITLLNFKMKCAEGEKL